MFRIRIRIKICLLDPDLHENLCRYETLTESGIVLVGNLGDLEESSPTLGRPPCTELYAQAIRVSQREYGNRHVYPYLYSAGIYIVSHPAPSSMPRPSGSARESTATDTSTPSSTQQVYIATSPFKGTVAPEKRSKKMLGPLSGFFLLPFS